MINNDVILIEEIYRKSSIISQVITLVESNNSLSNKEKNILQTLLSEDRDLLYNLIVEADMGRRGFLGRLGQGLGALAAGSALLGGTKASGAEGEGWRFDLTPQQKQAAISNGFDEEFINNVIPKVNATSRAHQARKVFYFQDVQNQFETTKKEIISTLTQQSRDPIDVRKDIIKDMIEAYQQAGESAKALNKSNNAIASAKETKEKVEQDPAMKKMEAIKIMKDIQDFLFKNNRNLFEAYNAKVVPILEGLGFQG